MFRQRRLKGRAFARSTDFPPHRQVTPSAGRHRRRIGWRTLAPGTVATANWPTVAGCVTVAPPDAARGAGVELITKASLPGPSVEDPVPARSRCHDAKLTSTSAGTPAWTKAEAEARADATSWAPAAGNAGRCSLAPSSTNARARRVKPSRP